MHDHQHTDDPDVEALWEAVREHEGAERARALCLVGEHLFENGDVDTALAAADAAKELFLAADEVAEAAMCDHNAAVSLHSLGRLREAIWRHEHAVDRYMAAGWTIAVPRCQMHLADLHEELGDHRSARELLTLAERDLRGLGDDGLHGEILFKLSLVQHKLARFGAAERSIASAMALLERAAPIGVVACAHRHWATVAGVLGNHDVARREWRAARAVFDSLDDESSVSACEIALLGIAVLAGEPADVTLERILDTRVDRQLDGDSAGVAWCDMWRARVALADDVDTARDLFEDARNVFQACGRAVDAAEATIWFGHTQVLGGNLDEGAELLRSAIRTAAKVNRADLVVTARLFLVRALRDAGRARIAEAEARALRPLIRGSGLNHLKSELGL